MICFLLLNLGPEIGFLFLTKWVIGIRSIWVVYKDCFPRLFSLSIGKDAIINDFACEENSTLIWMSEV